MAAIACGFAANAPSAFATPVLTSVPGSPFATGSRSEPASVAFSPSGGLLATADFGNGTVSVFSVNSAGALSQVSGSPFPTGSGAESGANSVAFSSSGGLLATVNYNDWTVSAFSVNSAGVLSQVPGSPFPTGAAPVSVAFSPSGGLLATANSHGDTVSVFSVNSAGALSQVPGSPFMTGSAPWSVAFSPSGDLLAVANDDGATVSVFSVNSAGALSQVPGSPFANDSIWDPVSVAFSPSGGLLATANSNNGVGTVSVFSVGHPSPPTNVVLPNVSGSKRAKGRLRCSTGSWTNSPTGFAYQWADDGTPVFGATKAVYSVPQLEEGTTLTCTVTASNSAGTGTATSHGVKIPVPVVPRCPGATGHLSRSTLGLVKLGATRSQEHRLYRRHADRGTRYEDFFCLTPIGVRVGYGSPKLLRILSSRAKRRLENKVVWTSTSNPFYSIDGVRPGESITTAAAVLHTLPPLHIGRNRWYLAVQRASTDVLKVRGGVVEEIGIATHELTATPHDRDVLMHSFY